MTTKIFNILIVFLIFFNFMFSFTKLFLDTKYKISYVEYSNLDFDFSTSSDVYKKVYSTLNMDLKILLQNIEYNSSICSIGEFGSDYHLVNSTKQYLWEKNLPYPDLYFRPWLAEFYIKYKYDIVQPISIPYVNLTIENIKFNFTVGRQRKEFIEGFVVGDNKIGYDGISFNLSVSNYVYFDSLIARIGSQP
ncbi:MAG: hypothetical protein NZ839_03990, partial [Endomicrobia bacterium]|nr:hypothetical protein [Endomicrobiia bacterium]